MKNAAFLLVLFSAGIRLSAQIEVVSGGNVGIGTTSPANKLSVEGTGDVASFGSSAKKLYFAPDSNGVSLFTGASQAGTGFYANAASNYFSISTNSTEKLRVDSSGNVGIGTTSPGYKLDVNGTVSATDFRGAVGTTTPATGTFTTVTMKANSSLQPASAGFGQFLIRANGNNVAQLGIVGNSMEGDIQVDTAGNFRFSFNSYSNDVVVINRTGAVANTIVADAGSIRFGNYGAGTLTTDSSGNITATSDARAKDTVADFTTGLAAIRQLQPKKYHWKKETGLNTDDLNVSVYAQDLLVAGIPEAVFTQRTVAEVEDVLVNGEKQKRQKVDANGKPLTKKMDATYYTVSDRAVISVLINAVKELAAKNDALEAKVAALKTH